MVKLRTFTSKLEAQLASQLLSEHNIRVQVRGAKEYVSHVLGSDLGYFDLLVDETKIKEAEALLRNDLRIVSSLEEVNHPIAARPQFYLKKAVLYAVFAVILFPIVFNYYSLLNLKHFLDVEGDKLRRIQVTVVVLLLQVPSIYAVYFMVKAFLLIP